MRAGALRAGGFGISVVMLILRATGPASGTIAGTGSNFAVAGVDSRIDVRRTGGCFRRTTFRSGTDTSTGGFAATEGSDGLNDLDDALGLVLGREGLDSTTGSFGATFGFRTGDAARGLFASGFAVEPFSGRFEIEGLADGLAGRLRVAILILSFEDDAAFFFADFFFNGITVVL